MTAPTFPLRPRRRAKPARAILTAALLAVAGCVQAPPPEPAPAPQLPAPATVPSPVPEPTVAPPLPPPPDPSVLSGMTGDEVTDLIGAPAFRRADPPGAIWRYQYRNCILDVYLRTAGSAYRVVHYEFRPSPAAGKDIIDARHCMAELTRRHTERAD